MVTRRTIFIPVLLVLLGQGCATKEKPQVTQPPPHGHYHPFTTVIGDYHVRLVVDHSEGELTLIYEDISEKPVKVVRSRSIEGKAVLPDGTIKSLTFHAVKAHWGRRQGKYFQPRRNLAGTFHAEGEWIKTTPKFELVAELPLKGTYYKRTFEYEVPGGEIRFHRK